MSVSVYGFSYYEHLFIENTNISIRLVKCHCCKTPNLVLPRHIAVLHFICALPKTTLIGHELFSVTLCNQIFNLWSHQAFVFTFRSIAVFVVVSFWRVSVCVCFWFWTKITEIDNLIAIEHLNLTKPKNVKLSMNLELPNLRLCIPLRLLSTT